MGMWDWIRDTLAVVAPPTKSSPERATPRAAPEPAPAAPAPAPKPAGRSAEAAPEPTETPNKRRKKKAKERKKPRSRAADPSAPKKPKKPNKGKNRRPPGWSGGDRGEATVVRSVPSEAPATASSLLPKPKEVLEPAPPFREPEPEPEARSVVAIQAAPSRPSPVTAAAPSGATPPSPHQGKEKGKGKGQDTLAWIVLPKLEALLTQVDEVLSDAEAPRDRLVSAKKRFLREWKALRPIPASDAERLGGEYDLRLSTLGDRIDALPDPKKEEEARNVALREGLIEEALALSGVADIKQAVTSAKGLQKRWRESPRVSRDAAKALQERFKAAVDAVFARRQAEWDTRLERLNALADSAQALTRTSDKVRAADAMKQLQAQWKEVGGVPGEAGDTVWKRFRGAADQVFEARRAFFEAEHAANVAAREALIAEANTLAGDGVEDPEEVVRALHRRWKKIGRVPREQSDQLWAAFREACDRLRNPPALLPEELGDGQGTLRFNPFAGIGREDA